MTSTHTRIIALQKESPAGDFDIQSDSSDPISIIRKHTDDIA